MTDPLFTVSDIARRLGVDRKWVHNKLNRSDAPKADFTATVGRCAQTQLWTERGVRRWEIFCASLGSTPAMIGTFSDHHAVNRVANLTVTWRLWWRCASDGDAVWWFSTPQGWWVSNDDGRDWRPTETMTRPGDYHYFPVNESAKPSRALAAVMRSANRLRQRLESDNRMDISADDGYS